MSVILTDVRLRSSAERLLKVSVVGAQGKLPRSRFAKRRHPTFANWRHPTSALYNTMLSAGNLPFAQRQIAGCHGSVTRRTESIREKECRREKRRGLRTLTRAVVHARALAHAACSCPCEDSYPCGAQSPLHGA
jgi:hypothetical protein